MRREILFSVLAIIFLMPALARPEDQTHQSDSVKLTLRQCLDAALENNPQIEIARQRLRSAEAKAGQARSFHFPQLGVEAGYTVRDADRVSQIAIPDGYYDLFLSTATYLKLKEAIEEGQLTSRGFPPGTDPYVILRDKKNQAIYYPYYKAASQAIPSALESGYLGMHSVGAVFSLTLPIFTGGEIVGRNQQAQWNRELETVKQEDTAQELLAEVSRVYFSLAHGEQARILAEEMEGRFEGLKLITEGFVRDIGSSKNKYDFLTIQTYLKRINALRAEIQNQLTVGKLYLRFLTSLPQIADVESNTRLPQAEVLQPDVALTQLKEKNSSWQQLERGRKIAEQEVKIARAGLLPDVGVKGAYTLFHEEPEFGYMPESSWEATLGAQWNFPLGLQTFEAIKEKEAESLVASLQVEYAQRGLETQLTAVQCSLDAGREQVELLSAAAALAQERSRSAVVGFRVDLVGTDELIRSHVEESEMRLKHLEAVLAYRQQVLEYYRLLGKDIHELDL